MIAKSDFEKRYQVLLKLMCENDEKISLCEIPLYIERIIVVTGTKFMWNLQTGLTNWHIYDIMTL